MHARLTTVRGARDIEAGVAYARDVAMAQLGQLSGFRGLSVSADRAARELVVLTLWEREADVAASERVAARVREDGVAVTGGALDVRSFEQVAADVGPEPPTVGCALRVRSVRMAPGEVDGNIAFFRDDVVPRMRSAPGYRAVRYLVDRATGDGFVGVVWSDEAALRAGDAAFAGGREEASVTRGVEFGETSVREVLFTAMA